jgi:AAA domain (dynein-related subfamily)
VTITKPAAKKPAAPAKKVAKRTPASAPAAQHPLAHLIPEPWMTDEYIPRVIDGQKDVDILDYARKSRQNVLIYGPTGSGKTSCVYAYAAANKIPLVYIACNGAIDPATMFSRVITEKDGSFAYLQTDVVTGSRVGPCIILLDEINFVPAKNLAVFNGAWDKRRTMSIMELNLTFKVHPETMFVGTFNPDYEGTKPMNEATLNRFQIPLEYNYDPEIEKQLILGIPVLLELAGKLRAMHPGDIETPVGPNVLLEFEQIAWDVSVEFAIGNFVRRFKSYERSAVQNVMKNYQATIISQYNAAKSLEDNND